MIVEHDGWTNRPIVYLEQENVVLLEECFLMFVPFLFPLAKVWVNVEEA